MDAYGKFAAIYDQLMDDVPYDKIAELIDNEISSHGINNPMVLDLACGTGTLTGLLKNKGYDMIGADISAEMLMIARRKTLKFCFSISRWRILNCTVRWVRLSVVLTV